MPDLERLLARIHAFSTLSAANSATHYENIGKARLNEFIKALEGFEGLAAAVDKVAPQVAAVADAAPGLASMLTSGEGFPDLSELLEHFRNAFDWAKAQKEGRVVPKPGTDDAHDAGLEAMKEAEASLEDERKKWAAELGDRTIEFWTPQGNTSEPYQLCVSEATLGRTGVPEEFEMVSQKKGFKRFYTSEIKEIKDQYNEAKAQTEEALKQAANRLFARFSTHFPLWKRAVSAAAELDCLISLAKVSAGPGMCRPRLVDQPGPFLKISGGVNPCVAHSLAGRDAIPNDITIGSEAGAADEAEAEEAPKMLLVTGPNMGGKSTLLRQACLSVLLAQLGCHVPADACALSPVDRIFTRVGANDAIMAGLSTFRVELDETALILKHATEKSLVILDELGRGTATFDGMAIAHAVLDHLVKVTKCRALFATHYHALTRAYERPNAAVALYHMACVVDDATRDVTFLYKFTTGACNRSHGVHVARLAGLPAELLAAAEQKSKAMEATLDEKYKAQLARRLLALPEKVSADEARELWHEVKAMLREPAA